MSNSSKHISEQLLERYLQAVRFWLPKKQQQDIIAELSEDLRSQIEEKEAKLGRPLNETEVEDLLRRCGSPILVASHYQPQTQLIGPVLFPIYKFVMKLVLLWILVPVFVVIVGPATILPVTHRWGAFLQTWSTLWHILFFDAALITAVFAVLERTQTKLQLLEKWSPRSLPPACNPNQILRTASILELAVNFVLCTWWIANMSTRVILDRPEIRILLSPVWRYFFWGFLFLAVINMALAAANLVRPYWTPLRAAFRLASDCAGSALICWSLKADLIGEILLTHASVARALALTNAINLWMARSFPYALATGVVIVAVDIHRIFRVKTNKTRLTRDLAAAVV